MKIIRRLRDIYNECSDRYIRLSQEVEAQLKPRVEKQNWFYLSRVKELESFALKIETGRVSSPENLEDFFACTIVVPTMVQVKEAEGVVYELFDPYRRRPKNNRITHKASSSFEFDDLRLYVIRRQQTSGQFPDLDGIVFEVQIKTILQHAWTIATHDLIYKTDTVSWPTERIAFQVKAMLEHAEIAISEVNNLATAPAVDKSDKKTEAILQLTVQIREVWDNDHLPADIKRLSETIFDVLSIADLPPESFQRIIDAEKSRFGILPVDLSPYAFTLQALAHFAEVDFEDKFKRKHIRTSIFVHDKMDLPNWMNEPHRRIVNIG